MYSEIVFISKIVDCARVLENKDCGFGPREIDLTDPGFLLVTRSSGYRTYALTECHSGSPALLMTKPSSFLVDFDPLDYATLTTRALKSANPARPYIWRLIVFSRFPWPSTRPLLQRVVTAAFTANSSRRMPSAKLRISGQGLTSARDNHSFNVPVDRLRINSVNSSA